MTYSSSVVSLQAKQKIELEALIRCSKTPQKAARRARALLELGAGAKKAETARKHEISRVTLNAWIARFRKAGVPGILKDAPRPGRKKSIPESQIRAILEATLQTKPEVPA